MIAVELEGEKVRLRPVAESDVPLFAGWFHDPEVRYWLHHSDRPDATEDEVRTRFGPATERAGEMRWTIDTRDGQPAGMVRLDGIDPDHGRAELAITVGADGAHGQGYGSEAIRLVLRHAFGVLGLRRVFLITDADNARGIRCYEKCGFVREGVLRAHRLRHGKPLDMLVMGVLREELRDGE